MEIGLGTVQFGTDYGLTNQQGQTPLHEVQKILQLAQEKGVRVIDTACSYGNAESVIGHTLPSHTCFRIITKTPLFKKNVLSLNDVERLKRSFWHSLQELQLSRVSGLLIHHADDLISKGGEKLFAAMQELQAEGVVGKIGVSVYTREQIDHLLAKYRFELIQVPLNVFDQRLLESDSLKMLNERGVEIHVRSVFLQGLLLMEPASLHPFFYPIQPLFQQYKQFLQERNLTSVEGALAFVKSIPEVDVLILGVNNVEHLRQSLDYFKKTYDLSLDDFKLFSLDATEYLNPSLWNLK